MWRRLIKYYLIPALFVAAAIALSWWLFDVVATDAARMERLLPKPEPEVTILSEYDKLFKEIGEAEDVDWILLSAIASVESKFDAEARSNAGAVGLMQVMPSVARSMGYDVATLKDPRVNVEIAAKLLHENNDMLNFSPKFNKIERLNFILACYNAGYSRIADARRLARYFEENAGRWSVVSSYLPLLAEPEYAEHEVVTGGPFYGSAETIAYVKAVMRVYKRYKRTVEEAEAEAERVKAEREKQRKERRR